ncbi:MAG: glycosyl transferase [Candidatus Hydrogenedentota bacterium]
MRIGIDAHSIGTRAGGNETYMRELLFSLREYAPDTDLVVYAQKGVSSSALAGWPSYSLPRTSSYLRVPLTLPRAVRRSEADLLHVQYNAPPVCPCPFVVSMHDIGWVRYPEFFTPGMRRRLNLLTPNTLRRAQRVLALTKAVAQEISDAYRVQMDRIDVVAPGVDPAFHPEQNPAAIEAVRRRYHLPREFVLYTGALQPRKNLTRLAAAFSRLIRKGAPHSLVVAGRRAWLHKDMLAEIERFKLGKRLIFTGYVEQTDLPCLFAAAAAFAYVSVYEGFGLPVLEAMASGLPVLTSDIPAIREVARDGVLYCDPFQLESIENGLERVLSDESERQRLAKAGPRRASHFSRKAMAKSALESYRIALGGSL